jgi:hypothetical protein
MSLSGNLNNFKLGGVGSVAEFSQGSRTFVPAFNNCIKANSVDQFGRPAGFGSLDTVSQGGCYSPLTIMENENSLRSVLSSNPLYRNIQSGIGNGGASTLFGGRVPGLAYNNRGVFNLNVDNSAACQTLKVSDYKYPESYLKSQGCPTSNWTDSLPSARASGKTSDSIYSAYKYTNQ